MKIIEIGKINLKLPMGYFLSASLKLLKRCRKSSRSPPPPPEAWLRTTSAYWVDGKRLTVRGIRPFPNTYTSAFWQQQSRGQLIPPRWCHPTSLDKTLPVTLLSMKTGPTIPRTLSAAHTVTRFGRSVVSNSRGFSVLQIRQFCLLT